MITLSELTPNAQIKIQCGTIFVIEKVENNVVYSHLLNGKIGNYQTEINDAIEFFNEEKSIKL